MNTPSWLEGTLYSPDFEQDSCGFGLMAQLDDQPSHWLVKTAISSLACLTHRGAGSRGRQIRRRMRCAIKKPDAFLRAVAAECGFVLNARYAAGLVFLNQDASLADTARTTLVRELEAQGVSVAGFRQLPIDASVCGEYALATLPRFEQIFVNCPDATSAEAFERKLYIARRLTEKALNSDKAFYVPTLSSECDSVQGAGHARRAASVLQRLERRALCCFAGGLPSTVFHQHLAGMALGSAVPLSCAQRRNQYRRRQPQLVAGA
jgi:glutamate synthase (NADPH) large subunit (EC 1.4.1.13)